MTRLARLVRSSLDDEQRALFDVIAGSERDGQRPPKPRVGPDGALEGPFNAQLYNPAVGAAFHRLADAVRYRSHLTDRQRELAILLVASAWDSAYERYAHEAIGRAVGLTDDEVAAVAAGRVPDGLSGEDAVVARTGRRLAIGDDLSDEEYDEAVRVLGERKLVELVMLVGVYAATALQLRVFRVRPPEGAGGSDERPRSPSGAPGEREGPS